jgi:glycosyltransferase involved in cell wall biosynthesis
MIDLLVVSHACFISVNRSVYSEMLKRGIKIEIVVPKTLHFATGLKNCDPKRNEDPPLHFLDLMGDNPRSYYFRGIKELIYIKSPRIILLDNDPVSNLAYQIGKWCKKNDRDLFCISCENLSFGINETFNRRGWKGIVPVILKRILLNKTRKLVHGVFCINMDGKDIFTAEKFKKVLFMPLGFNPDIFYPNTLARKEIRNKLGIGKFVVAYFGRLTPEKGVHILLEALSNLKDKEWVLMMDEFDEYANYYNSKIKTLLAKKDLQQRVIFVNPNHFEIAAYMNASDVIVVPSLTTSIWKEQYGRVVAEGMACGKQIITSDSGALPMLLNGNGSIFREGKIEELEKLLRQAIQENEAHNNSYLQHVSDYAHRELSINKQIEVLMGTFDHILKRKKAI